MGYDPSIIDDIELRRLIQKAKDAVPEELFIEQYAPWKYHCQAVINTMGGPTRHQLVLLHIILILI